MPWLKKQGRGPPGKAISGTEKSQQYCNALYINALYISCLKKNNDECLLGIGFKKVALTLNPKVVIFDLKKTTPESTFS